MIRVYLVDDHEIVREGLRALLESEPDIEVVGESDSAAEAIARIPAFRPDVALLDAVLEDGSGIGVCQQVRAVDPSIKALIVTAYADEEALFAAIMAGASGYVLKSAPCADLATAVRKVAAGQALMDPALTGRLFERIRRPATTDPRVARLSGQEREVLRHMAEGLSNRQIAGRMQLTEKTVKNYVSSVLAKLGVQRRTQAALMAAEFLDELRDGAR